eukprot:symbB.v1.2.013748.t1/scaffold976.1/size149240/1
MRCPQRRRTTNLSLKLLADSIGPRSAVEQVFAAFICAWPLVVISSVSGVGAAGRE